MPWNIYNLDFKRKILTWTGIRTSDLKNTSLALLPIELSNLPSQFMFKRSSWNGKCQMFFTFLQVSIWNTTGPVVWYLGDYFNIFVSCQINRRGQTFPKVPKVPVATGTCELAVGTS